ncbi:hypothetical protein [Mycobacterium sp. 050134]|uniref:hypothetical protein n=1 Tax=Mycobacterium sp. 050134 TaxID=3096111 RepID=UPI002EDAE246
MRSPTSPSGTGFPDHVAQRHSESARYAASGRGDVCATLITKAVAVPAERDQPPARMRGPDSAGGGGAGCGV